MGNIMYSELAPIEQSGRWVVDAQSGEMHFDPTLPKVEPEPVTAVLESKDGERIILHK